MPCRFLQQVYGHARKASCHRDKAKQAHLVSFKVFESNGRHVLLV